MSQLYKIALRCVSPEGVIHDDYPLKARNMMRVLQQIARLVHLEATEVTLTIVRKEATMSTEFEMSEDDLATLLDACKPTPVVFMSDGTPVYNTPQENANAAWKRLGEKLGFNSMTVKPVSGKGTRFFTAEPTEQS